MYKLTPKQTEAICFYKNNIFAIEQEHMKAQAKLEALVGYFSTELNIPEGTTCDLSPDNNELIVIEK